MAMPTSPRWRYVHRGAADLQRRQRRFIPGLFELPLLTFAHDGGRRGLHTRGVQRRRRQQFGFPFDLQCGRRAPLRNRSDARRWAIRRRCSRSIARRTPAGMGPRLAPARRCANDGDQVRSGQAAAWRWCRNSKWARSLRFAAARAPGLSPSFRRRRPGAARAPSQARSAPGTGPR